METEYLGCSDGGCVYGHPGGMATNGGCHCLDSMKDPHQRARVYVGLRRLREQKQRLQDELILLKAEAGSALSQMMDVQKDCVAANKRVKELEEQLHRSATVCPKDGCMLWKGHVEEHATKEQVEEALAANSHPKRL